MQRLVFLKATCIDLPRYSPNNGKLRLQRSPSSRADERCTNSRPMCLEVRQLRELQLEESPKDPKQVDFFARSAGACRAESPRALGGRPGLRTNTGTGTLAVFSQVGHLERVAAGLHWQE